MWGGDAVLAVPHGVVVSEVLLPDVGLGAQGQVDLVGAVLHGAWGHVALGAGQHGGQGQPLLQGLLVVPEGRQKRKQRALENAFGNALNE